MTPLGQIVSIVAIWTMMLFGLLFAAAAGNWIVPLGRQVAPLTLALADRPRCRWQACDDEDDYWDPVVEQRGVTARVQSLALGLPGDLTYVR